MPALALQVLRRENDLLKLMRYDLSASGQEQAARTTLHDVLPDLIN